MWVGGGCSGGHGLGGAAKAAVVSNGKDSPDDGNGDDDGGNNDDDGDNHDRAINSLSAMDGHDSQLKN